jgi:hypothetical protein
VGPTGGIGQVGIGAFWVNALTMKKPEKNMKKHQNMLVKASNLWL